jgi:hypothetical protein
VRAEARLHGATQNASAAVRRRFPSHAPLLTQEKGRKARTPRAPAARAAARHLRVCPARCRHPRLKVAATPHIPSLRQDRDEHAGRGNYKLRPNPRVGIEYLYQENTNFYLEKEFAHAVSRIGFARAVSTFSVTHAMWNNIRCACTRARACVCFCMHSFPRMYMFVCFP